MKKGKQFAVIGLGRFGSSVACALYNFGYEVLAVDANEERVQRFSNEVTHVVQMDTTDEVSLQELGIRNFDIVVVAIGEDIQANVLTTLLLKEMGVPYIIAKAQNALHGKMLEKIGADKVVYPERDMGTRVAHNMVSSNVLEFVALSPEMGIVEITAPASLVGKTLAETNLRVKYEVNVVAIKRGEELIVPPLPNEAIQKVDVLIVVGSNNGVQQLEELE